MSWFCLTTENNISKAVIEKIKALQQGHLHSMSFSRAIEATFLMEKCFAARNEGESDAMWLQRKLHIVRQCVYVCVTTGSGKGLRGMHFARCHVG